MVNRCWVKCGQVGGAWLMLEDVISIENEDDKECLHASTKKEQRGVGNA